MTGPLSLKDAFLGRVSRGVAYHAPCSVLAVRASSRGTRDQTSWHAHMTICSFTQGRGLSTHVSAIEGGHL
jgi:hypothetical protein